MLVLLSPSQEKVAPEAWPVFDLDSLSTPSLHPTRRLVADALVELCGDQTELGRDRARATLGVLAGDGFEIERNAALFGAPCGEAGMIYGGEFYEALDLRSFDAPARRLAQSRIRIASTLFGLLAPDDRVPDFRLSVTSELPGVGSLQRTWREPVGDALREAAREHEVMVDLRSFPYQMLCPIPAALVSRTVTVKVWQERDGVRVPAADWAKHTKGILVRALVSTPAQVQTPRALAGVAEKTLNVDLRPPRGGKPWLLDVKAVTPTTRLLKEWGSSSLVAVSEGSIEQ